MVNAAGLAKALNVTPVTVYQWAKSGKIPFHRESERKTLFNVERCRAALAEHKPMGRLKPASDLSERIQSAPAPKYRPDPELEAADQVEETSAPEGLQEIRLRAAAACGQAWRDVVLGEAKKAKARGDIALQAGLLEDFVTIGEKFMEVFGEE
jgi:hypothetical protein